MLQRSEASDDDCRPSTDPGPTFGRYAARWLADRNLKPRTRELYESIYHRHLERFHEVPLEQITQEMVGSWHADLSTGPTAKAHAYALLRMMMNTAMLHELITSNPCRIRGAGKSKPVATVVPATQSEVEAIVGAMPEQYRVLVLLAAWCGLRYGELAALRNTDIDSTGSTIHVRRGVVRVRGRMIEDTFKPDAGIRDVSIPPHLASAVLNHLHRHSAPERDGLVFPSASGAYLPTVTLYKFFYRARAVAGRPDLRWHDLGHAVLVASTGAIP